MFYIWIVFNVFFFKDISGAQQGCIYLIVKKRNIMKYYFNLKTTIFFFNIF